MSDLSTYNPLDRRHLGESIVSALECRPLLELKGLHPFKGAGIYSIYYKGRKPLWDELHPGRAWASRCEKPAKLTREEIQKAIAISMEAIDLA